MGDEHSVLSHQYAVGIELIRLMNIHIIKRRLQHRQAELPLANVIYLYGLANYLSALITASCFFAVNG